MTPANALNTLLVRVNIALVNGFDLLPLRVIDLVPTVATPNTSMATDAAYRPDGVSWRPPAQPSSTHAVASSVHSLNTQLARASSRATSLVGPVAARPSPANSSGELTLKPPPIRVTPTQRQQPKSNALATAISVFLSSRPRARGPQVRRLLARQRRAPRHGPGCGGSPQSYSASPS